MKIYYIDCSSGISGDMFVGALLDLGLDFDYLKNELKKLNLRGYLIRKRLLIKKGIKSIKFDVVDKSIKIEDYNSIIKTIDKSSLNVNVKDISKKILSILGNAEAKFHKIGIDKVHFHEMSAIDTIIDITAAAIGIDHLKMDNVYCSTINLGGGKVRFSHGAFDVPAPATKILLERFKTYKKGEFELTTPTGAAIINYLCSQEDIIFLKNKMGYGAGSLDLYQPNVLKIIEGENMELIEDTSNMIEANIDNMNPEIYDYVIERLFENHALDVFLTPIYMKKNRPAVLLNVLCKKEDTGKMLEIIFSETTTLGVRMYELRKLMTKREIRSIKTKYGDISIKYGLIGNKVVNVMPEFEECKNIAKKNKVPLKRVYGEISGKIYKN